MAKSYRRRRKGRKGTSRRRRARRNYAASGLIANPRRRRRSYRRRRRHVMRANPLRRRYRRNRVHHRRRHYRRNPGLMGISLPPLDAVLFTGAGLVIPPIMTSFLMGYIPATWKTSKAAYYGVKVASVLIPSMLVRKFISRRAGNFMLVGGAASFAIDLVREFAPNLLPAPAVGFQPFLGFYERMPLRVPMTATPGMGRYASIPVRSAPVLRTPMVANVADRLNPSERF